MGYTSFDIVRKQNREKYGIDGPKAAIPKYEEEPVSRLEKAALEFLYEECEELGFDRSKMAMEDRDGRSIKPGQIPFNMEKDIDRLCLENAIHRFMKYGAAFDAFDVYFCYLEMFVGRYGESRKMLELLSEFETNTSVLLMQHRDHYVHSVYVFILGMAIYHENRAFRRTFSETYGFSDEKAAAHAFLRFWGLTALFHDIGYPMELPFEQVKNYFGRRIENPPYLNFMRMDGITGGKNGEDFNSRMAGLLADKFYRIYGGESSREEFRAYLEQRLKSRPCPPGDYMDHAYFSAVILTDSLRGNGQEPMGSALGRDAVTAILLHNSFFRFVVRDYRGAGGAPLSMENHPIAYLLMLCDELQCWDRVSYGQNSRRELHAMGCDFTFTEKGIFAHYVFDSAYRDTERIHSGTYRKMSPAEGEEKSVFLTDIEKIVAINTENTPQVAIDTRFEAYEKASHTFISDSSFLHLYNFAAALNGRYLEATEGKKIGPEELDDEFEKMSLEYKLSNLLHAKAFAGYLDRIGAFYTDRAVAYERLRAFTKEDMDVIGPLEHERWLGEKLSMGWALDDGYTKTDCPKEVRERTRTHKLMVDDYFALSAEEQDKDTAPMNRMLELIEEFDGLRVYRM